MENESVLVFERKYARAGKVISPKQLSEVSFIRWKIVSSNQITCFISIIAIWGATLFKFVIEECRHLANGGITKCDCIDLMLFR